MDIIPTKQTEVPPTQAQAVRIIVTYKATLPVIQYGSLASEAMAIIDLPPDTTPEEATLQAGQVWQQLHSSFEEEFRKIALAERGDFKQIPQSPMQAFFTAFNVFFGRLGKGKVSNAD